MPLEPEQKIPSDLRKDRRRDKSEAIVDDTGTTEGGDRDLAHGEGGTLGMPAKPDLNRDD